MSIDNDAPNVGPETDSGFINPFSDEPVGGEGGGNEVLPEQTTVSEKSLSPEEMTVVIRESTQEVHYSELPAPRKDDGVY